MADIEKITQLGLVPAELINDLRQIIDSARSHVAATANYELTAMYWNIGNRINRDMLNNERAEYGKQIVATVARQLQEEYGTKGFEERTIRRMMQFALQFPDFQIVSTLLSKLSCVSFSDSYADKYKSGIRVAQYLTELPSKDVLLRQLQKSLAVAKETNQSHSSD